MLEGLFPGESKNEDDVERKYPLGQQRGMNPLSAGAHPGHSRFLGTMECLEAHAGKSTVIMAACNMDPVIPPT